MILLYYRLIINQNKGQRKDTRKRAFSSYEKKVLSAGQEQLQKGGTVECLVLFLFGFACEESGEQS